MSSQLMRSGSLLLFRNTSRPTVSLLLGTWCRHKSSRSHMQEGNGPAMVESADGEMIVCYHPTEDFPYEHTRPIPRPDPSMPESSAEGMLKVKFKSKSWDRERQGPSIEELSEMFYTTKHRWYPLGIRRRSLAKPNPPRDRPDC
ncbi:large ribosomal subunit protein mL42-like [Diadema antillarum]|uniref:large ribosomal subunit protein mL42-like n=1 Tax=Diadema antillarum TaxID=105358 RepID=UPI003A8B3B8C